MKEQVMRLILCLFYEAAGMEALEDISEPGVVDLTK